MFEITTFHPSHMSLIDPHPVYSSCKDMLIMNAESIYKHPESATVSLSEDGEIVGCVGLIMSWPGSAMVWTYLSNKACSKPIKLHKTILKLIRAYADGMCLVRVAATTQLESSGSRKWLKSLGFKEEGIMRKYGPDGGDWVLLARIFK